MTEGSNKERHFELSLRDSGLHYEPGDSFGSCLRIVRGCCRFTKAVGLSGEETVEIGEESIRLKDAWMVRLACTVLSKIQIKKFDEFAQLTSSPIFYRLPIKSHSSTICGGNQLISF